MFPSGVWISWGAGTPQFTLTTCSLLWILWKWHSNTGTHQVSSVVSLSDPLSVLLSPPHCEPQSRISGLLPGQLSPPGVCGQWWPSRCSYQLVTHRPPPPHLWSHHQSPQCSCQSWHIQSLILMMSGWQWNGCSPRQYPTPPVHSTGRLISH